MSVKHRARLLLQRAGIDVDRFPGTRPEHRRVLLLHHHDVSLVLDVGANTGQYGSELRRFGYEGRIVSFEPVPDSCARLQGRVAKDAGWTAVQCALGAENGEVTINVAGNGGASSSVVPMLDRHLAAAPDSAYVSVETVALRRLDDLAPQLLRGGERSFLKIDVQGYERSVLEGADRLLADVVGVQLELSLVPLYAGGLLLRDAIPLLDNKGFVLESLDRGFTDPRTGQLLQVDGLFFRR